MHCKLIISYIIAIEILLISCKEEHVTNEHDQKNNTLHLRPILVDYKSKAYNIRLGDNYKKSENCIDWHWSYLEDTDQVVDSTGTDYFFYIGEALINYNQEDFLPALYITTEKNAIKSFTCSIVFDLQKNNRAGKRAFLKILSKDISSLKKEEIIRQILAKGSFTKIESDYLESFKLTEGEEIAYDRFEYNIKYRKNK